MGPNELKKSKQTMDFLQEVTHLCIKQCKGNDNKVEGKGMREVELAKVVRLAVYQNRNPIIWDESALRIEYG
jgi:hypothetical protein